MLLELFAGIQGGRCAFLGLPCDICASGVSDVDEFAALVQRSQWPDNFDLGNVAEITEEALSAFLSPHLPSVDMVVIVAGLPGKETATIKSERRNLAGHQEGKFKFFLQIYEWMCKLARSTPVKFIVEQAPIDEELMMAISRALSCTPLAIQASPQSGAKSSRLYWINWEFSEGIGDAIARRN